MTAARPKPIDPRPIRLPDFSAYRRTPTRSLEDRELGFDAAFDSETLIYDAFRSGPNEVTLAAPPLFDLTEPFRLTRFTAGGRDLSPSIRRFDRAAVVTFAAPENVSRIACDGPLGAFEIAVQTDEAARYAGRRVLLTLSKDNPIPWILDWARHHRDVHGADAVLVYDNGSTAYPVENLLDALAALSGFGPIDVVRWPFKYGPQGTSAQPFWDSNFCQLGQLEHARRRFLRNARSVLNGDVDEMVLKFGAENVFAAAERSPTGNVRYAGRWMTRAGSPAPADPTKLRHRDFRVVQRVSRVGSWGVFAKDALACPSKWTASPAHCPDGVQWKIHALSGWRARQPQSPSFGFRHFRELTTNWKYSRSEPEAFAPARHEEDVVWLEAAAAVAWES